MIYLAGDMHGPIGFYDLVYEAQEHCLSEDDYLIVLGDFGLIFAQEKTTRETHLLNTLNEQPWTTLFIDGNHENFQRLWNKEEFPDISFGGAVASKVRDKVIYLQRGAVYTIEDKTFLTIGGADSIDKAYRTPNYSWWEQETITQNDIDVAMKNMAKYNYNIDYMLTHTCPKEILPYCFEELFEGFDESSEKLSQIADKIQFKKWYFGHLHIDKSSASDKNFPEKYHALYNDIVKIGDDLNAE